MLLLLCLIKLRSQHLSEPQFLTKSRGDNIIYSFNVAFCVGLIPMTGINHVAVSL